MSTMSAACRATSVPVCPMAMPTSAAARAGASLMPSPVAATKWPSSVRVRTILSFCSGVVRAKTEC